MGRKRECSAAYGQLCSCPRNCKRCVRLTTPLEQSGKANLITKPQARRPAEYETQWAVGCGGNKEHKDMTTQTQSQTTSLAGISAAVAVAAMGIALMVITGHVQAATLHDAAHDVRHATGFPCH